MALQNRQSLHFLAVDCCEHVVATLKRVPDTSLTPLVSKGDKLTAVQQRSVDLIVIGPSTYPVRRLILSQLRRLYPKVPMLILRRVEGPTDTTTARIRGEFILCDEEYGNDIEIVQKLRQIMPFSNCAHFSLSHNYDTVREVIRIITNDYKDTRLNLTRVARLIGMSPSSLSRILNNEVGVSFRQLLRQTRIEEAKLLLASKFSVKEVAAQVGFSNSHYFSRVFKELTGLRATEFKSQDTISS